MAEALADPAELVTGQSRVGPRPGRRSSRLRRTLLRHPRVVLLVLFGASRVVAAAAGVRFDASELYGGRYPAAMQLLDVRLLRSHLLASVWELHSQPPLYNLACGLLLKLPAGLQVPVAWAVYLGIGVVIVVCSFDLMVELAVPVPFALIVAGLIILDPSFILSENWLSYGYPAAALVVLAALALLRFCRSRSARWGAVFFASVALTVLLDSVFQYVWLAAACVLVVVTMRRHFRLVATVAAIPLLLVATWAVKDAVLFGTSTTSSWIGMNLTKTTLRDIVKPGELRTLEAQHVLTPLAAIPPFAPLSAYVPRYARSGPRGTGALDQRTKSNGYPNYDNQAYVAISSEYLHQDLAFIVHEPRQYLMTVLNAAKLATVPPDQYEFLAGNRSHLSGWSDAFDTVVLLQPSVDRTPAGYAIYLREGPGVSELSYTFILSVILAVPGALLVAVRRRRDDPGSTATLVFVAMTVAYVLTTSSLIEFAENERYSMDLGSLTFVASAVVLAGLARSVVRWRRRTGPAATGPGSGQSSEPSFPVSASQANVSRNVSTVGR